MLAIGGILILVFILIEWRFASLPIMPCKSVFSPQFLAIINPPPNGFKSLAVYRAASLTQLFKVRLFTNDVSANLILTYGTLQGVVYWANLFYVPLYLQNVRGYGPTISGAVIVPMLVSHGIGSIVSGQIISRTGRYNIVIVPGNFVWTIGVALQTLYTRTTPIFVVCLIGFIQGIGIGFAFQRKMPLYCA